MALCHQPSTHIFAIDKHLGQPAAMVIHIIQLHRDTLAPHQPGQGFARLHAPGLAHLGRVNAFDAQLLAGPTLGWLHMQGVAIDHFGDPAHPLRCGRAKVCALGNGLQRWGPNLGPSH